MKARRVVGHRPWPVGRYQAGWNAARARGVPTFRRHPVSVLLDERHGDVTVTPRVVLAALLQLSVTVSVTV